MKRFLLCLLLLPLLALTARADEPDKDVSWKALDEIARRGDYVEHVDGFQGEENPIADALQPPEDDSYKWNITLVTTRGCRYCETLKRDIAESPTLAPWVNVQDYKKSWAHYQVVDISDPTQAWRWKHFKPTTFPTLILQPPFNGSWGEPHTIVFLQSGYGGKPEKLDADLRKAIERYAVKVHPKHMAWHAKQGGDPGISEGGFNQSAEPSVGGPPPFVVPGPSPATPSYQPYQPAPQQFPPPDESTPVNDPVSLAFWLKLLTMLVGSQMFLQFALPLVKAWQTKAGTTPSKLDDLVSAFVRKALESRLTVEEPTKPPSDVKS